ncbi:MAG: GtrA family protein, partial [Geodermatophilaceae bacterium]|nr:GtrA family protein [Geodermatophilaceae bacterium]
MGGVPTATTDLPARSRSLVRELGAFGIVGLINLGIDVGLFNLLHFTLGIGPLTAKLAATAVSVTSAYVMHRHWSFSHRARTGVRREYPLFFLINGVALLIGLGVLALARYGLGLDGVVSLNLA